MATSQNSKNEPAESHPQQGDLGALLIWVSLVVLLAALILAEPLLLLFR